MAVYNAPRPDKMVYPRRQLDLSVIGGSLRHRVTYEYERNVIYRTYRDTHALYRAQVYIGNSHYTNQCYIQCSFDYSRIQAVIGRLKLFK